MAPVPGLLYVTMAPKPDLPDAQFHDWYNNEHGPGRLRLPFMPNGFRYRATDLKGPGKGLPEWMALYDVTDMEEMTKEAYLRLRRVGVQSQRERDTMKQIAVDRRLLDFVEEFKRPEDVFPQEGNIMVAVSVTLHPGKEGDVNSWYRDEHMGLLSKVPGWLRTRRYVTSPIQGADYAEYLALHEYAPKNGLGGPEFQAATSTAWANEIVKTTVKEMRRRVYELYYAFGPAPRALNSLTDPNLVSFESVDQTTRTFPATQDHGGKIESFVTTEDGVALPYKLEGSADKEAPLIVLSNSILVEWGIWDDFLSAFFSAPQNKKYRILRYHTRGRTSECGDQAITMDLLTSDIIALLDALRVPKAAAVIGVSLGGATTLRTALSYPDRVAAFISCDTSSKSPAGNKKTWGERIDVAEEEGAQSQSGEKVVGEKLAELTVRRWFVKESYENKSLVPTLERVKKMVAGNSLEGFKKSVAALYEYDMTSAVKSSVVKGAFAVGSGDGVLPGAMKQMAADYGHSGADYLVIEGAGHLPMVEKPKEFAEAVTKFLA